MTKDGRSIGSWARGRLFSTLLRKIRLNWILRHLEREMPLKDGKHPGRVLDLGCGDGWLTKELVERNYTCIGSDIKLRTDERMSYLNVEDAYDLTYSDRSFDAIIAIEVIEHLRPEVYGEIRRILKENGLFIVTTPQPWSEPFLQLLRRLKLITWVDEEDAQHINAVKVESVPFRLVEKRNIAFLDQFGVFRV